MIAKLRCFFCFNNHFISKYRFLNLRHWFWHPHSNLYKKFCENTLTASDHLERSLARGGVCRGPSSCQVLEHKTQLPYISNICGYSTNEALHAEWHARLHLPCKLLLYTQDFTFFTYLFVNYLQKILHLRNRIEKLNSLY